MAGARHAVPLRVRILTLGCKVNQCDSEEIARGLAARGCAVVEDEAEVYVVNTCTVTSTADAKARKLIRKLAREHPGATVIVTGCLAARDPEGVRGLPGVVGVVKKEEVGERVGRRGGGNRGLGIGDREGSRESRIENREMGGTREGGRTRAFLKVQDGCDHGCAYCAVPGVRGAMVSKPREEVLGELARLAEAGVQEVVLCGIRLGAYDDLPGLLRELRSVAIPRVRLSSLEPMDVGEALLAELADHPRLCHHVHLPLQSGDDGVLAAMGRTYTSGEFAGLVARIRAAWPEAAVSTDVLVGFPGETDAQFRRTVEFAREMQFSRIHVFPYSARPRTPAAKLRGVPAAVKRARKEEMLQVAQSLAQEYAQTWLSRGVAVLVEERGPGGLLTGLTEQYVRVWCHGPEDSVGRIMRVRAREARDGELLD
jgi:threonylcarbamoyladenosine tRNA methylthiotransferase MtaB